MTAPPPAADPATSLNPSLPPPTWRGWLALAVLSMAGVAALAALRVSAAWLLGPIGAAIVFAVRGTSLRVPPAAFVVAQAVVGCMIARTLPVALFGEIARAWPLFAASVGAVLAASVALGWVMTRWRLLPGTTAIWGSFPGAATAMVLMADAFGADTRLVALMQYLRVLMVGVVATTVTRLATPVHSQAAAPWHLIPASPPLDAHAFAATLALVVIGAAAGLKARIPAGSFLLPMAAGLVLQDSGLLHLELPWWLLCASYALVGWTIGLRFTREILRHAAAVLPQVLAAIAVLIATCGAFGWVLAQLAHVDPLTAYLATSPGGADTVAIIASTSPVDVAFVMAMQSARFVVVAFCGPLLARAVARRAGVDSM